MSSAVRSGARAAAGEAARSLWLWAPAVAYMTLIFVVSSGTSVSLPANASDKIVHVAEYALLAVLLTRGLVGGLPARIDLWTALVAIGATVAYGASDEWHQSFVVGRNADRFDLIADAVGAVVGAAACWAWGTIWIRADV